MSARSSRRSASACRKRMRTKSSKLWGSTADEATRMEDYARILDFLPQGHPDQSKFHREPLAYALGVDEFKLFELVPKEGVDLSRSEEHTSELQSPCNLVCRLLLEKK